jgi:hypothetical protein
MHDATVGLKPGFPYEIVSIQCSNGAVKLLILAFLRAHGTHSMLKKQTKRSDDDKEMGLDTRQSQIMRGDTAPQKCRRPLRVSE